MKTYLRIYRWAMQMKLHMALYTFTAIFLKALCQLLQGTDAIAIIDLLTMWVTCFVFAVAESFIFPEGCECTRGRFLLWLAAANLCFLGGALLFRWFQGVPLWGGILLTLFLEMGLGMMWFGDRIVLKMDTAQLTQDLKHYQQQHKS